MHSFGLRNPVYNAIYSTHTFMHAIRIRVLRTVPICTVLYCQVSPVTETSICRFVYYRGQESICRVHIVIEA